jgi:hypothetical protein
MGLGAGPEGARVSRLHTAAYLVTSGDDGQEQAAAAAGKLDRDVLQAALDAGLTGQMAGG